MNMDKKMEIPIGQIVEDFENICLEQDSCIKCPFENIGHDVCDIFLKKNIEKFLYALYPKSLEEEIHEYFPKMNLESLCVCDILGLDFSDCICEKYENCEKHLLLSKEAILKEYESRKED